MRSDLSSAEDGSDSPPVEWGGFEPSQVGPSDSPFVPDKPEKKASERNATRRPGKAYPGTDVATAAWGFLGFTIAAKGQPEDVAVPVGRVMQFQAPDAGRRLAKIVAESPISGWLGPLAKELGWIGELLPLIGPPILVGTLAARPEMEMMLEPLLRMILVPMAVELRKAQREQAQATGIVDELDKEIGENVAGMLSQIFERANVPGQA